MAGFLFYSIFIRPHGYYAFFHEENPVSPEDFMSFNHLFLYFILIFPDFCIQRPFS